METRPNKRPVNPTLRERFARHVVVPPGADKDPSACFYWNGAVHSLSGAGLFLLAKGPGGIQRACRISFQLEFGPLLPWQIIRPVVCGDPRCVRASHYRIQPGKRPRTGKRYSQSDRAEIVRFADRLGVEAAVRTLKVPRYLLLRWLRAVARHSTNGHEGTAAAMTAREGEEER